MSTESTVKVTEAVDRLNSLAVSLGRALGPEAAAHVLVGAGVNALVAGYGQKPAAEFLRHLADDLEAETDAPAVN